MRPNRTLTVWFLANPNLVHDQRWIAALLAQHPSLYAVWWMAQGQKSPLEAGDRLLELPHLPWAFPLAPWRQRGLTRYFREKARDWSPDVIHSMYAVPMALWGQLAHRATGKPHVVTTRGSDVLVDYAQTWAHPQTLRQQLAYPLLRRQLRQAIGQAAAITGTSAAQLAVTRPLAAPGAPVELIRTGVELPHLAAARLATPLQPPGQGSFRLLAPRGSRPVYRLPLLLEAFAQLREALPQARLTAIDNARNAEVSSALRQQVADLGLAGAVTFLPAQPPEAMAALYRQAHLVVNAPSSDGTPVSALEAMALEVPVQLPPLPAYDRELFAPERVFYAPEATPKALAQTWLAVYRAWQMAPTTLQATLAQARQAVEDLANRQREMARVLALYQQLTPPPPTLQSA